VTAPTEPTTAPPSSHLTCDDVLAIYSRMMPLGTNHMHHPVSVYALLAVATEAAARARAELLARLDAVPLGVLALAYVDDCREKDNNVGLVWDSGLLAVRAALLDAARGEVGR
jgi:hypothetical protein